MNIFRFRLLFSNLKYLVPSLMSKAGPSVEFNYLKINDQIRIGSEKPPTFFALNRRFFLLIKFISYK